MSDGNFSYTDVITFVAPFLSKQGAFQAFSFTSQSLLARNTVHMDHKVSSSLLKEAKTATPNSTSSVCSI